MDDTAPIDDAPYLSRLLHRWLVEYNPLYLVSAALVLGGAVAMSKGLAAAGMHGAQLGITAIAELYAWALIAGAAVLTRIDLRRPALMLALLAALYQCDLTLQTSTAPYLGPLGALGSTLWAVSGAAKPFALVWALRLRASNSALAIPVLGTLGLAAMPWALRALEGAAASDAIALFVFAAFAAALWTHRRVRSRLPLGPWAQRVAARSVTAVWIGWGLMLLLHAAFWATHQPGASRFGVWLAAAALLSTRWVERERGVWLRVAATLIAIAIWQPASLGVVAIMAAATLLLRWRRLPAWLEAAPCERGACDPYRLLAPEHAAFPEHVFVVASHGARLRLVTGALCCGYLAAWTHGWRGGAAPEHLLLLDAVFVIAAVVLARVLARRLPLLLPAAIAGHLVVQRGLLPMPATTLQWGIGAVVLGFVLLSGSLGLSVASRRRGFSP